MDNALIYVLGGYTEAKIKSESELRGVDDASFLAFDTNDSSWEDGWFVGGGIEALLDAFMQILRGLPAELGMAIVFVQHLSPTHESALPEILSKVTALRSPPSDPLAETGGQLPGGSSI